MNRRTALQSVGMGVAGLMANPLAWAAEDSKRPNIVVILADDQGYADVSYHDHPEEVHTPHIDALARSGVRMTNGYASAFVCAPTRAGLMTGRYQQRFGFYTASDSRAGMPVDEITLADLLKGAGYKTGMFGKWHLGLTPEFHPNNRGFDAFYGFLGHGGHDYFDLSYKEDSAHNAMYRNQEIINDTGYLTDNLAREAVGFIEQNKEDPFFLYLPFNAVHAPLQAPEEDVKQFDTGDEKRNILMGMLKRMDLAVGEVVKALKQNKVWENTLIFYFSDNGGARATNANNAPLRGYKQQVYEGGLRVPFFVSWPGHLEAGGECDVPVICMDVLPTVCAAVGISLPEDRIYDGKNMLPALAGKTSDPLHDALYWDGDSGTWAIREGKWKLTFSRTQKLELYDLDADIGEQNDLADQNPELVQKLQDKFKVWRSQMGERIRRPRRNRNRNRNAPQSQGE